MKKKAIFGGTFNPIHIGHLCIAMNALYGLGLDEIIFMPCGNPPHKRDSNILDAYLRYEMVSMTIKYEEKFKVSNFEISRDVPSYTFETMEYFKKNEPDTIWYFLSGADCLMEIDSWKNVSRILNSCNLAVFSRPGYIKEDILKQKRIVEERYGKKIFFLDMPLIDISSTEIRNSIRAGKNVSCLLPESVWNFINQLNLYMTE